MAGDTENFEQLKLDPHVQDVIQLLPLYDGKFDPEAYIDWELKVDNEFDEHDLSEKEKIYIASNVLTEYALLEWKHICRHNKVLESWEDFKFLFKDAFIPSYYADYLLAKLDKLKQGSRTVREYFHVFKTCIMFGGLDESVEEVMSRFMRGLNSEIRTLLISKSYRCIGELFWLAVHAEKETLLFVNNCKNGVTHDVQNLSTLHANQEQQIVEPEDNSPLSQDELLTVPYDKEDLCVDDSFTHMPQVVNKCDSFGLEPYKCAEEKLFHPITCAQDELKLMSSLNTLGYIEFDILCDLNYLEEKFFAYSELTCLSDYTNHFIGKYNCKREYLVHKVYICSNLKYPFGLQYNGQIGSSTNTNDVLPSFSSFSLKQQGQPKEGEHCWLWPCNIAVVPCSNIEASTFECHWGKSRTTCSQERENNEDITSLDMTILMACKQKVNQSYITIIVAAFDELCCAMMCVHYHFQKYICG